MNPAPSPDPDPDAGRPLEGLRVLVTRPRHQAEALSRRLRALGAEPREAPTIRITRPADRGPLLDAARRAASYDWIVLTSVNGVRELAEALREVGASPGDLGAVRVAAIGPATASAIREAGLEPEVVPERYRAEALVAAVRAAARGGGAAPLAGVSVLLARAAEARDALPEGLREAGARVDEVPAYVTRPDEEGAGRIRRWVGGGELDWITFTSSSTVRNFVRIAGSRTGGAAVAAIGPITAGTAREVGLPVDAVAEEFTIPGLVRALRDAVARGPTGAAAT